MTPLRWFYGLYLLTFGVTVVVGFVSVDYVRWPMVALGMLLAVFGVFLATNLLGFATEAASNAATSKWAPPALASVPAYRAVGILFLLVGIAFAAQALLAEDL
jgi:uncharacterized membrane protein YoaT (DUF817 family)